MRYRITVDVGGTFTDVAVTDAEGRLVIGKAPTTPNDPFAGTRSAIAVAAVSLDRDVSSLLRSTDLFVYSTTRATNAILEHKTARTALLVTEGFPDILRIREPGKSNPFDLTVKNPMPYVPEYLTFEVPERIVADGTARQALDEEATRQILEEIRKQDVGAIAVCLLWSFVNPAHELRTGQLISEICPGIAFTLSHELTPVAREYRRATATAIDASLKPVMSAHLRGVATALENEGFSGELFGATIVGGVLPIDELASRPIFSADSGPAIAPVAGRAYGATEAGATNVIVCDMGGTSFDVSRIQDGAISYSRETWLGSPTDSGHLVATPSVDVRSIGAGGGSIGWIDSGGLLRVGPASAGSEPGPACYGLGGDRPTVTDAAVVLGHLPPGGFLGGHMDLDVHASRRVVADLGDQLGMTIEEAGDAILRVAAEQMVGMIRELTVSEGVDPRESLVVAGGGAAGLTISRIVAELGCRQALVPRTAGALSAVGGQYSDVVAEFVQSFVTRSDSFDSEGLASVLQALESQASELERALPAEALQGTRIQRAVTAKYPSQVWDIDVPLPDDFDPGKDADRLAKEFHATYGRAYSVSDWSQPVEFLNWTVRLIADLGGTPREQTAAREVVAPQQDASTVERAYFTGRGWIDAPILKFEELPAGSTSGPAIITAATSTLVVWPDDVLKVTANGHCIVEAGK